ncbi:MAG: EFR1 family ferrodoxin [Butyrivibrio sp.]|nr:EFR1 family ferrodoxin [Butyrivibrio sp.]
MDKNVIFYFSGTGNCLDIARNIAKGIGGARLIRIRDGATVSNLSTAEKVGFVFPCYGGGAPEDVLKFAGRLKINPRSYTFGITSCSAYAGTGLAKLNMMIPLKYWGVITHHCSCIWLFPHKLMMPLLTIGEAQVRSEELAQNMAKDIAKGVVKSKKPPMNLFNVFENMLWPAIAKKKVEAFSVSDKCIACGQCVKLCPRGNIKVENGRAVIGKNCSQCLGCLQFCPESAISIGSITDRREHYHNPHVIASDLVDCRIGDHV